MFVKCESTDLFGGDFEVVAVFGQEWVTGEDAIVSTCSHHYLKTKQRQIIFCGTPKAWMSLLRSEKIIKQRRKKFYKSLQKKLTKIYFKKTSERSKIYKNADNYYR